MLYFQNTLKKQWFFKELGGLRWVLGFQKPHQTSCKIGSSFGAHLLDPKISKTAPRGPKTASRSVQDAQDTPKTGPGQAQDVPRYAEMFQGCSQDGLRRPKIDQDGPRQALDNPKTSPRWPQLIQDSQCQTKMIKITSKCAKLGEDGPKMLIRSISSMCYAFVQEHCREGTP